DVALREPLGLDEPAPAPAPASAEAAAAAAGLGLENGEESSTAEPSVAALVAASAARRLLADAAVHITDMQRQLAVESQLRDKAEQDLQELKHLFDSYVQRTVAQVQSMSSGVSS
ncbi:hypothetical protein Vretifemale_2604, partial [Volvox reticuliferus]